MIQTSSLRYSYSEKQEFAFPDIRLTPGEHLLILGPSGIGKTTLLYLLSGLLPASNGTISVANTELQSLNRKDLDQFRGSNMGLIFQQYYFIKSLNVAENLRLRQRFPKKEKDRARREELVERLGLTDHLKKKVTQLSQGQQQRLSIALGLIHRPKVVFADEPTSNLDDANCEKVINLLKEEAALCQSSLVIITHDHRIKSHFENQIVL